MVMPGDNIQMVVELIAPIAMEDGLRFAIREGGKTVGAGVSQEGFDRLIVRTLTQTGPFRPRCVVLRAAPVSIGNSGSLSTPVVSCA